MLSSICSKLNFCTTTSVVYGDSLSTVLQDLVTNPTTYPNECAEMQNDHETVDIFPMVNTPARQE